MADDHFEEILEYFMDSDSEVDFEGFTAEDLRVVVGDGGDVSDVDSTAKLKHLVTPVCASVYFTFVHKQNIINIKTD